MTVQGAASVRAGTISTFTALLSDGSAAQVQWSVNGQQGGNATVGTIDASGQYTAPSSLQGMANTVVTIQATQAASPGLTASLGVQLLNPVPLVLAVNVVLDSSSSLVFTVTGQGFSPSASVEIRNTALVGGVLSGPNTMLLIVPAGALTLGSTVRVAVRNPDPGSTESQDFVVNLPTAAPPPPPPPLPVTPVPHLPDVPFDYVGYAVTNLPAHYTDPNSPAGNLAGTDNTPANNPITNAGATLGRVLFYDKLLSANNTTACASCHQQQFGFSDPSQFSTGFQGGQTPRRSMGLSNAKFYQRGHFFSDERALTLEDQVLQPIQNSIEMGNTLPALMQNMAATSYYPGLFQSAFGTQDITSDRISQALSQFIRSMVSYQSKYDQAFAAGTDGNPNFAGVFNDSELRGQALFTSLGCAQCHTTGGHVSDTVRNIGLEAVTTDVGAGAGAFKAPSLRNAAVRIWFMHDSRFEGLSDVIEFYNSGVQDNPSLDPLLRNPDGTVKRLNLSAQDKIDLLNFLSTLTDNAFLTDLKFSSPF
jgi:cytochrome c peroxidase